MKHLKFTYVDSLTGISIAAEPSMNGPKFPAVHGLEFVWARTSAYPTPVPEFFGTCPDDSPTQVDGVLGVFLQTDWEQMQRDEMNARPKPPDIVAVFDAALTAHLDNTAKQRRNDNRITCAVRAGYAGPFQAEGAAFALWMDECNALAYQMLAAVQAGTASMPESPQAFIDTLPAIVWPA